jgi:pimeloyl-ACP methyl ester carboxylesterase
VSAGYVEWVDELKRRRDLLRSRPTFAELATAIQTDSPETNAAATRLSTAKQTAMDPEAYNPFIEESMFDGFDPDSVLSAIRCPVLLMQAEFNLGGVVTDDAAARLQDLIPDCTHVKFPGTGHNIHEDAPIEFRRTLFDFLDTI